MTALTPQQMRELAERRLAARRDWASSSAWSEQAEAALRTAAGQLEAVRTAVDEVGDMLDGRGRYLSEVLREMLGMER